MQTNQLTTEILEKTNEKLDVLTKNHQKIEELLHENFGIVEVYKDIIRSTKQINLISTFCVIILFIFIILLSTFSFKDKNTFDVYRENSITKDEIIEILKNSTYNGE